MVNVSVIIPTLNEEGYIEKTLSSLEKQLEKGDEIILVDSYSKDNTVKTAKRFGARVVYIGRCGIGPAKTFGAKHAKNKIIAMLDADGVPAPDWLSRIKRQFEDETVNMITGIDPFESPNLSRKLLYGVFTRIFFELGRFSYKTKRIAFMSVNNCAIRKDVFLKYGGLRNVVCEDLDFGHRAKGLEGVIYDDKLIVTLSDRRFKKEGVIRVILTWFKADIAILRSKKIAAATDYAVTR